MLSGWVEMEVPDRVALSVEQLFGIVYVLAAGIHVFCLFPSWGYLDHENKRIPRRACLWGPLDALRLEGKRGVSVRGDWGRYGVYWSFLFRVSARQPSFSCFLLIRSELFVAEDVLFWRYWWSKYAPSETDQASLTLQFFSRVPDVVSSSSSLLPPNGSMKREMAGESRARRLPGHAAGVFSKNRTSKKQSNQSNQSNSRTKRAENVVATTRCQRGEMGRSTSTSYFGYFGYFGYFENDAPKFPAGPPVPLM